MSQACISSNRFIPQTLKPLHEALSNFPGKSEHLVPEWSARVPGSANRLVLKCQFQATREKGVDNRQALPSVEMIAPTEKKQKENKRYYRRGNHRSLCRK